MVLLIFGIGLAILIAGLICTANDLYHEWIYYTLNGTGAVLCILSLIAALFLGVEVSQGRIIDEKIALYEEENIKIEEQVATAVESYIAYEQETFDKIAIDGDPTLAITLFPELKSNELVNSQIELYQANNATIKQLKSNKLNIEVCKWWLYFG